MAKLYQTIALHAQQRPEQISVICDDIQLTYQQLLQQVDHWASFLSTQKSSNDAPLRILTLCAEPTHNLILALALAKLNALLIPANAQSSHKQVISFCRAVSADLLIYDIERFETSGLTTPYLSFEQGLNMVQSAKNQPKNIQAWSDFEASFLLTLSSGSTGKPKPIVISQDVKLARAQQTIDLYDLTANDVVLNASPFFHSLGQRLSFVPLVAGATVVYLKKFTPNSWLETVAKHQVTFTIPVATHLYAIQPKVKESIAQMSSLRCIVTSSAPIDADFKKALQEEVGCTFYEIYGATEVAIATNLEPSDFAKKYKTVGRACQNVQIQILSPTLESLPSHTIGQIAVKTPLMFSAYDDLPELTEVSMHQGYFLTGDLGFMDDEGYLTYVSRQKDVIISGGINIYPAEVEQCLLGSKLLSSVCVIGVNDSLLGEALLAICVGDASSELKLRQLANQELVPYQRPIQYFFVEALPLTPSGKIDKMALREFYNNLGEDWSAKMRAMLY